MLILFFLFLIHQYSFLIADEEERNIVATKLKVELISSAA